MMKDCSGRNRNIEFPIPEFAEVLDKALKEDSEDKTTEDAGNEDVNQQNDEDIICTTYYQSECITKQEEHQV